MKKSNNKNILFIGSESYDAPTVTIIEGLHKLGWNIYTLNKFNINSWFCNKIINTTKESIPNISFVLSNLHWGTRWSYYDKFDLHKYTKILVDGDDNPGIGDWKDKYAWHCSRYPLDDVETATKELELSPFRWMENIGNYKPDIVFSAQKNYNEEDTVYIPFGIHEQYYDFSETFERKYLFTHIPGPGENRRETKQLLEKLDPKDFPKDSIWNKEARGEKIYHEKIKYFVENDPNVHSWHRWVMPKDYFHTLKQSKVLIYPGVDHWPFWDSKRPWEAIASGCAVLIREPSTDTKDFSICDINRDFVYKDNSELIKKMKTLQTDQNLDEKIDNFVKVGQERFSSQAIAKYFLEKVGINES